MKYYSAIRNSEILSHVIAQKNLENMLIERSCHKRPYMV